MSDKGANANEANSSLASQFIKTFSCFCYLFYFCRTVMTLYNSNVLAEWINNYLCKFYYIKISRKEANASRS